jgi:hypothetical protein
MPVSDGDGRMRSILHVLDNGSRAISLMLGGLVVVLAAAAMSTSMSTADIIARVQEIFGITFISMMGGLVLTALYCWSMAGRSGDGRFWTEAGLQAANGIATLALTYTLLGISLGIGTLAEQELTPDTVRHVIRGLTSQFSLAFMTTVVGLPTAAILRTLLVITHARTQCQQTLNEKGENS